MRRVLKEMEKTEGDVMRAAASAPRSFAEGVQRYVADRRDGLEATYLACETEYQTIKIARNIIALQLIAQAAGTTLPEKKWRRARGVESGKTGPENRLFLAKVMCPEGWEDDVLPVFDKLTAAAQDGLLSLKDVGKHLAVLQEVKHFVAYLRNIEQHAERAKAEMHRRVVNG